MENQYSKDIRKIRKQIISYSIIVVLFLLLLLLIDFNFFTQKIEFKIIILAILFYIMGLAQLLCQTEYILTINDDAIQITNKILTNKNFQIQQETIFWEDITKISFSKKRGIKLKALTGKNISIKRDVMNYQQAWNDIVLQIKHVNPNINIPSALIHALKSMGD